MCSIPVVDFSSCNQDDPSQEAMKSMGSKLVDILSETGFVYLRNHGIENDSIDEVNYVTKLFFESPLEVKSKYSKDKTVFGYVGVEEERLDPSKYPGYKEVFNVSGCFLPKSDYSQWPDSISPQFSKTIKNFMAQCKCLSLKLLDILAVGLQLYDIYYFRKCHALMHQEGNYTALRSLYYPSLPDTPHVKSRLGEHSDYGSITLLFQDQVGGLQVQCANGNYIEATPIEGTVLVNIGDAMHFWTNGKLKSTKHKVELPIDTAKRKTVRRSIAYFVLPDNQVRLDIPLVYEKDSIIATKKIDENILSKSSAKTFIDYLEQKLTNSFNEPQKL